MSQINVESSFQINDIVVDPVNNKLVFFEKELSAPHKLIKLLQYLAANPNRLITNDELSEHVWDGVVSEGTRYVQIANLRKLLNDDSNEPRFLKTVPRKGYMFIAKVEAIETLVEKSIDTDSSTDNVLPPEKSRFKRRSTLLAVFLFALVSIITTAYFVMINGSNRSVAQDKPSFNYDYRPLLRHSQKTIVINSYVPEQAPEDIRKYIALGNLAIWHQLSDRSAFHVERAHFLSDYFIYERLHDHFELTNPVCCKVSIAYEHETHSLLLNIEDAEGKMYQHELTLTSSVFDKVSLKALEKQIVNALYDNVLFSRLDKKPLQLDEVESFSTINQLPYLFQFNEFKYINHVRQYPSRTLNDHNKELVFFTQLVKANPDNKLFKYYLFDKYINHVSRWGLEFDLEIIHKKVEPFVNDSLRIDADNNRALAAQTAMLCARENTRCLAAVESFLLNYQKIAQKQNQKGERERLQGLVHIATLLSLAFPKNAEVPPDLARYAYEINPQLLLTKTFYMYWESALEHLKLADIQPYIQHSGFWHYSDFYRSRMVSRTSLQTIESFRNWYNQDYYRYLGDKSRNIRDVHASVRYIVLNLLNANRPDLVQQWADFTQERAAQLEGQILGNIWQGEWDPYRWYSLSQTAKSGVLDILAFDRWRIAYVELHAEVPKNALFYYQKIAPELFFPVPDINANNIRTAVYLSEALKKTKQHEQALKLVGEIKMYFDALPKPTVRTAYFGLTDIQFYALNEERERAMELLESAIINEHWLPNGHWLWPPIDKDPFLSSLWKYPQFMELAKQQKQALVGFCFGEECSELGPVDTN